jgi:uroporphyrinogen-III synthase
VIAYRTLEGPDTSRQPLTDAISAAPFDAIVFTSGSTIRGLFALLSPVERRLALRATAWCIGPATAAVAGAHGFGRVREASMRSAGSLATDIAAALADQPVEVTR